MNLNGIERAEQHLRQLSQEPLRYSPTGNEANVHRRYKIADILYDFLTQPAPSDSDAVSFVKAFGNHEGPLWNYSYQNIGTENKPILWGLEGVGDHRGVNFVLYIPVDLCYTLDKMAHGETNEPITPYHQNLLETWGHGISGTWPTVDYHGKAMRFVGRELAKEQFKKFMSFGSDFRLQTMARQIVAEVTSITS